jgi:hypothetical protein
MDQKTPDQVSKPGKGRWRIVIALGACALAVFLGVAFWSGDKEPEYKGKKLSEWLAIQRQNPAGTTEAVRAMGTNALPLLIDLIECNVSSWERPLLGFYGRHPGWVGYGWFRRRYEKRVKRVELAAFGFFILGRDASPALTNLERIARNPTNGPSAFWAANSMAYLGESAVVPLVSLAEDGWQSMRGYAMVAMANMAYLGTNAMPCVKALAKCANETNTMIKGPALTALSMLMRPDGLIFINRTNAVPDPVLRRCVLLVLIDSATNSSPYLYELISKGTNDPDPNVKAEAVRYLTEHEAPGLTHGVHE